MLLCVLAGVDGVSYKAPTRKRPIRFKRCDMVVWSFQRGGMGMTKMIRSVRRLAPVMA